MNFATLLLLLGAIITFVLYFIGKRKNRTSGEVEFGNSTQTWKVQYNELTQKSYNRFSRVPFIKGIISRIRSRLETLSVYEEYKLRAEIMRILFTILALVTAIVLLVIIVRPGWLVAFWIFLGVLFLSGLLVDLFVYRVEAKLLNQLKEFNNRVRYYFQQTKMVDEAVYESIQHVGPEMKVQGERIYSILTSVDPEAALNKYEEVSPSRFLKVIAGLAVLVKDQGDVVGEKGSAFLRGLTSVNQELNAEILYRSKLSYRLRGLSVLALAPIFFALPIQNWAISTFPIMRSFYDSRIGFISEVLVYGIALIAYLLIRKMREVNEAKYHSKLKRFHWENWLIEKVPGIDKLILAFSPDPFTKKYSQTKQLIKDANSPLKIEWLTLQKMVLGLSVVILLISGFIYAHNREVRSILFNPVPTSLLVASVSDDEIKAIEEMAAFDRRAIADIQAMELPSEQEIQSYISSQLGIQDSDDLQVKQATARVLEKLSVVRNSFLKWWEVLLAIALGYAAWSIPTWTLRFQKMLRNKDMENEVHQYLVLVSILRQFDRMSVYMILLWLERFAVVFREPIQVAIQEYDSGSEESLNRLQENVSFEPFHQIIERLKLATVRISIKETFDDIEAEREFYLEQRQESHQRSLESKSSWANLLGMFPVYALTFLYLVIPLIYLSFIESTDSLMYFQ